MLTVLRKMNELSENFKHEVTTMIVSKDKSKSNQEISLPMLFKYEDIPEMVSLDQIYKLFIDEMKDNTDKLFLVSYFLIFFITS